MYNEITLMLCLLVAYQQTYSLSTKGSNKKCNDNEIAFGKHIEQIWHTIPVIVKGLLPKGDNKAMSAKINVNTNDGGNIRHMSVIGKRKSKKHSILVVDDSHARGCSARVKDKLNDTFDVTGLVKPGTVINTLTSMAKGDMENLTDNDV